MSARRGQRIGLQRHPDLVVVRKREAFRHHADDRVRRPVHANVPSNDVLVAGVPFAPGGVRDDRDLLTARRVFARAKVASEDRLNADHGRRCWRVTHEPSKRSAFSSPLTIDRARRERGELGEAVLLRLVVGVVLNRQRLTLNAARRVGAVDDHDAVAVRVRQAFHQRAVHDAEHRRRESDAERQREHGDEREAGLLSRDANSVANVAKQSVHVDRLGWWRTSRGGSQRGRCSYDRCARRGFSAPSAESERHGERARISYISAVISHEPVWKAATSAPRCPSSTASVDADVCVVGLGGSGLACISRAARPRAERVVGIDAVSVAAGAAGRNGGFLLGGLAMFHHDAVERFGRDGRERSMRKR